MKRARLSKAISVILSAASALAQSSKFVTVGTPRVILEHVEVIDGTGAAQTPDRNIVIENGKIAAIVAGADLPQQTGPPSLTGKGPSS